MPSHHDTLAFPRLNRVVVLLTRQLPLIQLYPIQFLSVLHLRSISSPRYLTKFLVSIASPSISTVNENSKFRWHVNTTISFLSATRSSPNLWSPVVYCPDKLRYPVFCQFMRSYHHECGYIFGETSKLSIFCYLESKDSVVDVQDRSQPRADP